MSLLKQTQIMVTLLLISTLIVVLRINFITAREFTANESYLSTKNHANMLALTLSSKPKDEDFMRTSINAMFDGGYFESITLVRQDGSLAYDKRENVSIHGVPGFFIETIDLEVPEVQANVMAGWSIYGTLKIKGHPGASYQKLWDTFKQICIQFFILGLLSFFISLAGLRHLMGALEKIKEQAEEISNNEFIINKEIPRTPELKKVAVAMNVMVAKVKTIFEHNLENLSRYQKLKYKDKITGLYNRSFFVEQLDLFIAEGNSKSKGQVAIWGLAGLEDLESGVDRALVHDIFIRFANILSVKAKRIPGAVVSRLPRREFGIILPETDSKIGFDLVQTVIDDFLMDERNANIKVYGGFSEYDENDAVSNVLSRVDYVLAAAKTDLSGTVFVFQDDPQQKIVGKQEWKKQIEAAFAADGFSLTAQPVLCEGNEFHREIYVNMVDQNGVPQNANLFMPMIQTLGLASKLDRFILEQTADYLSEKPGSVLAVNITSEFCKDRMGAPWLRQFLSDRKPIAEKLVFEIHENTLINFTDICIDFIGLITGMGFKFGVDRFTMHDVSLSLLEKVKPQYIKVERDYLEVFDDPKKADMVMNSLFTITESLDIKLIAAKIENEKQKSELVEKNIKYFQGHGIAGIIPLKGEV